MNRKLLPLIGIAFVVAVIATGVFYGLIAGRLRNARRGPERPLVVAARSLDPGAVLSKADLKVSNWQGADAPKDSVTSVDQVEGWTVLQAISENEPLIRTRLASARSGGGAALAIPTGMRAVSIQTPDSPGVLRLLRAGHKVDVQVIRARGSTRSGETEIRTVLQGVEVLAVPDPTKEKGGPGGVLTVLARPSDAELLSLADASARVRVVLRNPLDQESAALAGGDLAGVFHLRRAPALPRESRVIPTAAVPAPKPVAQARPAAAATEPRVRFDVRIAGIAPAATRELAAGLAAPKRAGRWQVSVFRAGWDLDGAVERLRAAGKLEVLSSSSLVTALVTANELPVGMQAGPSGCGVRVQLAPTAAAGGRVRLRVEGGASESAEIEVADGQPLVVWGLAGEGCSSERLYAGRAVPDESRELVALVTPRLGRAAARTQAALLTRP